MSGANLIQIRNGKKAFGSRVLLNEVTFSINEDEHVGVIGPNGAGKTTLFKILTGLESLDEGEVTRARMLSLGYLTQHDLWEAGETGQRFLERTSKIPLWEVKSLGRDLQVSEEILAKPLTSLSGGYRMRVKLLGLLGQAPNLMLLDEPTNYLDLETVLLLEKFLQGYQGSFLLISHDREFLRRTTNHVIEVEDGEVNKFAGNIDDYFEQKEMLRSQLLARARSLAEKRKEILDFVTRFGAKATKAKQAQSRLKSLERMETIEVKPLPVGAKIRIPAPLKTGKQVLLLQKASFGYGDRKVIQDVSFAINRGDHLGVVGLNGQGKSTLLKGISTLLPLQEGTLEFGQGVTMAIFHQHVVEELQAKDSVLQSLEKAAHSEVTRQEILDLAGSLLFSGDAIQKPVSVLSGGEKSRVALGRVLLRKPSCLILDEPTNHLDFQTVEALTAALHDFEGTLVTVSHDRGFIGRVANKIIEVNQGKVSLYPGTYDEYVWSLEKRLASDSSLASQEIAPEKAAQKTSSQERRENRKAFERELRTLEKQITQVEKELEKHRESAARLNDAISRSFGDVRVQVQELTDHNAAIDRLEESWLELAEKRQTCEAGLAKTEA